MLVKASNQGSKIADNVCYRDEVTLNEGKQKIPVEVEGLTILGGETKCIFDISLPIDDPASVDFSNSSNVIFKDLDGVTHFSSIPAGWEQIAYDFPEYPKIVDRDEPIDLFTNLIREINSTPTSKLLLVEGIEGSGKSRLIHEFGRIAQAIGFRVVIEDSKDRNPVKRLARRILGLEPEEENNEHIWNQLTEYINITTQQVEHDLMLRLTATFNPFFNDRELDIVAANLLRLIKQIAQEKPLLIIVENIQWVPYGEDEHIILRLFEKAMVDTGNSFLVCATYRPSEETDIPVLRHMKVRSQLHHVKMTPVSLDGCRNLVDQIVTFPQFNDRLHQFVYQWSNGNPFYVLELLRHLTHRDTTFLVRSGQHWYLSPGISLDKEVPDSIEDLVLRRIEVDLKEHLKFAQVLSTIGFELPQKFIDQMAKKILGMEQDEVEFHLNALHKAGILARASYS